MFYDDEDTYGRIDRIDDITTSQVVAVLVGFFSLIALVGLVLILMVSP